MFRLSSRIGFTLIELLVVIAIIGVLIGITLPAVQMVRESARRVECLNQVRQIALGAINYESSHNVLPPGLAAADANPYPSQSWLQALLPFVEQMAVYDQAVNDYMEYPDPFRSHTGLQTVISLYECPSQPDSGKVQWTHGNRRVAMTSYLGVNGTDWRKKDGVFFLDSRIRFGDIADGSSNTLMIGERPPSPDYWYGWWYTGFGQSGSGSCDMLLGVRERKATASSVTTYLEDCPDGPYDFASGRKGRQCDTLHFWSYHPGGAVFAMCDGSARLISYNDNQTMPALATRAGQEVIQQ